MSRRPPVEASCGGWGTWGPTARLVADQRLKPGPSIRPARAYWGHYNRRLFGAHERADQLQEGLPLRGILAAKKLPDLGARDGAPRRNVSLVDDVRVAGVLIEAKGPSVAVRANSKLA